MSAVEANTTIFTQVLPLIMRTGDKFESIKKPHQRIDEAFVVL